MPATDPQQAQTQKMMSFMSPLMLAFFGFKYAWPSALTLYWLASNVFTMAQQFYLLRRFHEPLSFLDSAHVLTDVPAPADTAQPKQITGGSKKKAKGTN
jgi:YidC/Oxa1 family membrane protein insertase